MAGARGLGWYAKRLSVMGPRELAHRVGEQGSVQWLRLRQLAGAGWPAVGPPPSFAFCAATAPRLPALEWDDAALAAAAPALLAGEAGALGFDWRWTAGGDPWHRAPDTGRAWPRRFFAALDYREGNPVGDARVAWEPARLQWLVALGRLAATAEEATAARAAALLEDALASWLADNPPWRGVHWVSAMECALRIIAACHALDLARARLARREATWDALLRLVASHAEFIARRLSLHSSAGNHTVAEGAGLAYAGTLFPELPGAAGWARTGLALLAAEAPRQVLPDGGGAEQAPCYLRFVTDLLGLVAALPRPSGPEPPAARADLDVLAAAHARGAGFLARLAAAFGTVPPLGDADDGWALSPFARLPAAPAMAPAAVTTFPDTGCTVLRAGALRVLVDHGPLGMAPSHGHGHADALAVLVRDADGDVLVDAGTFTYTGAPAWRRYFRSTAAHNTVVVDGADQAVQETAFMWSGAYACRLVRVEAAGGTLRLLARHDGYGRLGVVHWRGVALREPGVLVVWDRLEGPGRHALELRWHAAAPATRGAGGEWLLGRGHVLEMAGAEAVGCAAGSESPPGGWRSPRYGRREPITTISASREGALPHELVTCLHPAAGRVSEAVLREDVDVFRRWSQ